jgi:hypothetical protein
LLADCCVGRRKLAVKRICIQLHSSLIDRIVGHYRRTPACKPRCRRQFRTVCTLDHSQTFVVVKDFS